MSDDEYGPCPNCGSSPVHISDLGNENGIICCKFCYFQVREDIVPDKMQHFVRNSFTDNKHGWSYDLTNEYPFWLDFEREVDRWLDAGKHIPTQDQIDVVCDLVSRYKNDESTSGTLREFLQPLGIGVRKISEEVTIVYWLGDPRVKTILTASLKNLPEFLTSEDFEVRLLATHRLEELNK